MKYCNKCGSKFSDDVKFCRKCGSSLIDVKEEKIVNTKYNELDNSENKKSSKMKFIIAAILIVIIAIASTTVYFLTKKSENKQSKKLINIQEIKSSEYPKVSIIIKAKSIDNIKSENITLKEGEYFPKDISVEKSDSDRYVISYSSSNSNAGKKLDVDLEYIDNDEDIKCSSSYTAPEIKSKENIESNVSLNTYDENVKEIEDLYGDFIYSFIDMINYGDVSYIYDYVVIGSNIYKDMSSSLESFKKQDISEEIEEHNIQEIKKIDDNTYELYAYEVYDIYYGEEHSRKLKTFNSVYTVTKSNGVFKFTDLRFN